MIDVSIQDDGALRILTVNGEIDFSSAPTLWQRIRGAFDGAGKLRVQLRDVSYMDSTGVAVLVQGFRHAKQVNVDFALLDPSPEVTAIIDLSRLNDLFTIERSA